MPGDSPLVGAKGSGNQRQAPPSADGTNGGKQFLVTPPAVSLPKGGGAIRGIGEKFASNPVTGSGSMSVPIALSPGRGGFGPQLSLNYDSAAGQSVFGLGWSLSAPGISRKTDKGLPRYQDNLESDVFLISGAEDLVPVLNAANGQRIVEPTQLAGERYNVHLYRPRVEGLFARIERWTQIGRPENTFWRSLSRDNITTWYGRNEESRIFDPEDHARIYQWLICETYDDKGNVAVYRYLAEDNRDVDSGAVWEVNRQTIARENRYLKRILYGNIDPYLPRLDRATLDALPSRWIFEAVFDYGDHGAQPFPMPQPNSSWHARSDAFSNHRTGFAVRTHRLCRRVLMFHHFPDEPNVGQDCLVRSTNFNYVLPTNLADAKQAGYTVLRSVTHRSYQKRSGGYEWRDLPPVEFTYSEPTVNQVVQHIDASQLENLPVGTQGPGYRWIDLNGEGLSGVLSEHAGGWYYKPNLGRGTFGAMRQVARLPAMTLATSRSYQFMDLAGDGEIDVVEFDGATPGFYEREADEGWKRHVPFASLPNINWQDPNLRFVDLTGDGHADALLTEHEVFTWYPSLDERGFAAAQQALKSMDEDAGPHLVFADGTQSIFLADMCGDGLTDLVRIRNGEVVYWPNLGYGSFGRKVTLGNSPLFEHPDLFDPTRVRLSDIDGSGPIDIIYLGREGARVYFNRSGNSLSDALIIALPVATENLGAVQVADLMGNGTACLVWNSHLPADTHRPACYIDLMGGQKPHLLISSDNNLGATTQIEYAPSTKFYLQDEAAGRPWITKLPFPVHVVEKVTVTDKWRRTSFTTTYSYHHGYFDGVEREFRGFGRVEQIDVENYGLFSEGNIHSPYITQDKTLYQPPVKTITWFHTGADLDRQRILSQFEKEYFPNSLAALPSSVSIDNVFRERALPEPDLDGLHLTADEWREALRACKGMTLRQEVYELDIDPLHVIGNAQPRHVPVRLYSASVHNCEIRCLQGKRDSRHAVFLVTESEALSYHYELDLRATQPLAPDPRVAHTLNLSFDEYGNIQQSISAGYPRLRIFTDLSLIEHADLIRDVQRELHIAYSETHYTVDAIDPALAELPVRYHRLRVPCEVQTYELTGFVPTHGDYFGLSDFRGYKLSETLPEPGTATIERKLYHERPQPGLRTKRLVEHARTLFFDDDPSAPAAANRFLKLPFALGTLGRLGLVYEQYKLALTTDLLNAVFTDGQLDQNVPTIGSPRDVLDDWRTSGYLSGSDADDLFGTSAAGEYWMRSGTAGFSTDAADHFYLPERYTDPFDNTTTLQYDGKYDLFVQSTTDALGNTSGIYSPSLQAGPRFDYRVLAPIEMVDINGNRDEVCFDVLGMVIAAAVKGKGNEADNLNDYTDALANPTLAEVLHYFDLPSLTPIQARDRFSPIIGNATSRFLYHFGQRIDNGNTIWADRPAGACAVVREQHVALLQTGNLSPLQIAFECSDGMGAVLMKRNQAEPEQANGPLRWIVSGKTVVNNKGKPVKQYEPYFSVSASCCAEGDVHEEVGVTSIIYYDAVGRVLRTELPDGTISRVEVSPWFSRSFDQNDTVLEANNRWYAEHTAATASAEDKRAARLATVHAGTPAETHFDSLGRDAIAIVHNRIEDPNATLELDGRRWRDERYLTFTKLDTEGKPLWIRDARSNLVMQYIIPVKSTRWVDEANESIPSRIDPVTGEAIFSAPAYDIAGNLLFQHSMDAGDRWMLTDAAGKPMFAWDLNNVGSGTSQQPRLFKTEYDALHRPTHQWGIFGTADPALIEAFEYIDVDSFSGTGGVIDQAALDAANARNVMGQAVKHWDPSGLAAIESIDLSGKPAHITRTLIKSDADGGTGLINWNVTTRNDLLEVETFHQITKYDALGRMTLLYNWHRDFTFGATGVWQVTPGTTNRVAVYEPGYNERGTLLSEWLHVSATKTTDMEGRVDFTANATRSRQAIKNIRYNEKGQKLNVELGNDTTTAYTYDPKTFRLTRLRTARTVSPTGIQQLSYVYDPVGNITYVNDAAQDTVFTNNMAVRPDHHYSYDALYRLIDATGRENPTAPSPPKSNEGQWSQTQFATADQPRNYSQQYAYDEVGNFVQMTHAPSGGAGWTRHYTTQADSNRLDKTWYGGDTNNAVTYHHDAHGNMLNLNRMETPPTLDPDEEWGLAIRWDWRDMIRSFDCIGGGVARYHYGIDKQRTRKHITRIGSIVEDRIYLDGYELYRRSNAQGVVEEIESHHLFVGVQRVLLVDDVIITNRTHANGISFKTDLIYRYQYSNHLGSACLELDDIAEIISYEEYHAYGTSAYRAMNGGIEASPSRYRFTGMERDEESGLGYHSARYYLPSLARWASTDPMGLVDGPNLYLYARINPIAFKDPSGNVAGVDDAAEGVLIAFAALVLFTVYWTMPSTQENIRKLVNDITEKLTVPRLSPFERTGNISPLVGNPEDYKPKPGNADSKPKAEDKTKPDKAPDKEPKKDPDPKKKPDDRPPPLPPDKEERPKPGRVYVNYIKEEPVTHQIYCGRTDMEVDLNKPIEPQAQMAVRVRDRNRTDQPQLDAFGPARIDVGRDGRPTYGVGRAANRDLRYGDNAYYQMRGWEQQCADFHEDGIWAEPDEIEDQHQGGSNPMYPASNRTRPVAVDNPHRFNFWTASTMAYGQLAPPPP